MQDIESIKNSVLKCELCHLSKTRTSSVPGKGSFTADVIFVGEAPGRSEDQRGEPFVGAAGKKLTAALETVGVLRDAVYITNIVKCRPPDNRVPTKDEVDTCMDYLQREIMIINPKIICILGNTAYSSLLDGDSISKNRGKVIRFHDRLYFLTFHPAATIYNQSLFDVFCEDLKKLFFLVKELKDGRKITIDHEKTT